MENLRIDARMQPVYRALLERGHWPEAELAARLGQDPERLGETLGRLAALRLVRRLPAAEPAWCVVTPELGLGALLARQEAELAEHARQAQESRAAVMQLLAHHEAHRPEAADTSATSLRGPEEIRLGLDRLCRRATHEIVCALPGPSGLQHVLQGEPGSAERALARGVRIRALHLTGARNGAPRSAYDRRLADAGAEIRTAATVSVPLTVVDRSVAVVQSTVTRSTAEQDTPGRGTPGRSSAGDEARPGSFTGPGRDHAADLVTSPALVAALYALFEREWAAALPGGAPPQRREDGLSDQEHALLELLCEGLTDEMAARRLGVSLRTVRRTMSDLLARTGVKSRFQIGVVTGALGWTAGPRGSALRAVPAPGRTPDRRTA